MASLYATLLADARFHELLLAFDGDLADAASAARPLVAPPKLT